MYIFSSRHKLNLVPSMIDQKSVTTQLIRQTTQPDQRLQWPLSPQFLLRPRKIAVSLLDLQCCASNPAKHRGAYFWAQQFNSNYQDRFIITCETSEASAFIHYSCRSLMTNPACGHFPRRQGVMSTFITISKVFNFDKIVSTQFVEYKKYMISW